MNRAKNDRLTKSAYLAATRMFLYLHVVVDDQPTTDANNNINNG